MNGERFELWIEASRIAREDGPEAARAWFNMLTPEQQAVARAQGDQVLAFMQEVWRPLFEDDVEAENREGETK
jgi:hypothetical protein